MDGHSPLILGVRPVRKAVKRAFLIVSELRTRNPDAQREAVTYEIARGDEEKSFVREAFYVSREQESLTSRCFFAHASGFYRRSPGLFPHEPGFFPRAWSSESRCWSSRTQRRRSAAGVSSPGAGASVVPDVKRTSAPLLLSVKTAFQVIQSLALIETFTEWVCLIRSFKHAENDQASQHDNRRF